MELPICEVCAKTGLLCPGCEERLERGEITETDVEVSKKLVELKEEHPSLEDVALLRTIDTGNLVVLVTKPGMAGKLIGKRGRISRALSDHLGKKVRVVEEIENPKDVRQLRKLIQDLILPARLLSVNVVYEPDGERYKAVIHHRDRHRVPADTEELEKAVKELTGIEVEVTFG
ncbi:hypothetical protein [Methanopyrus sp.]